MFLSKRQIRSLLQVVIANKAEQGHIINGLDERLYNLPDRYDDLFTFAQELANLPLRADWPYVEPNELDDIWAECAPDRPMGIIGEISLDDAASRVESGFLGSVCGCILGKPLEINPTLNEIRQALESIQEWPMNGYISERTAPYFNRRLHESWSETVRERIAYVAPDDDINYTVLGMLLLEQHGRALEKAHIRNAWLRYLPPRWTFGPERMQLVRAAAYTMVETLGGGMPDEIDIDSWVNVLNPKDEFCGAMIRADAYGYACPGDPSLAAELAWRDASWTHRRTGIYGTMFTAAAIACAQVLQDPLAVFDVALKFVPQKSRFYRIVCDSLNEIGQAVDWLDGYERIHDRYAIYSHCRVYQEAGTLINTLRFAESVGDGICKQVSQGNDTDSYGATAGSLLGVFFGKDYLEERWLTPFNDDIRTTLAGFEERSLSGLAKRMGQLPKKLSMA